MAHRFSARPPASASASHCSTSALRAALFAALGFTLLSGCGADSAESDQASPTAEGGDSTESTDTTDSTDSTSSPDALVCQNPVSDTSVGSQRHDVGYESCDGGWYHRSRAVECPSALPRSGAVTGYGGDTCEDTSCAGPHGFCIAIGGVGPTSTVCVAGCVRDDECGAGQVCFCDDPVGRCVLAYCATDADCPGSLCVGTPNRAPCGGPDTMFFACADTRDECLAGRECSNGTQCQVARHASADGGLQLDPRQCGYGAVCGRPFLVNGSPRQAGAVSRSDWASAAGAPDIRALDERSRAVLAAHWTDLGLMEHASVAAFARFVLELMAAGAPSELVASAQRALGDEVEHARLCFGLASAYAGEPLGPGVLSAQGVLDDLGSSACVVRAIHEACVGETLAAIEALEALTGATDPAVIEVLSRVVRDESAHAELGWKFLKWALATATPELRELARTELRRAIDVALAASSADATPAEPDRPGLEHHGLCPAARRHHARGQALQHIVAPLARALLAEPSHNPCRDADVGMSLRA
jgi:hypothetical protein